MKQFTLCLAAATLVACTGAVAQAPVSFEGKTVTVIVGYAAGGGTDIAARLIAPYLAKYLPGTPNVIVQNRPGADGLTSANYFAQQSKPDGLELMVGAGQTLDPLNYRKPEAKYDPTKFAYVGGVGRGGSFLVISTEAEKRLLDKSTAPAAMGSMGSAPHSTMLATAWGVEFLGWNARWVMGYRGTADVFIAIERGEVDMSGTGNLQIVDGLLKTGKFKILAQTGTLVGGRITGRSEFGDAVPLFAKLMEGKIKDPVQQKAFDYWYALLTTDKWVALPPESPAPIVSTYREAFNKMSKDTEFLDRAKKVSQDLELQTADDMEQTVKRLGSTPPEAIEYISAMLRKQGTGPKH